MICICLQPEDPPFCGLCRLPPHCPAVQPHSRAPPVPCVGMKQTQHFQSLTSKTRGPSARGQRVGLPPPQGLMLARRGAHRPLNTVLHTASRGSLLPPAKSTCLPSTAPCCLQDPTLSAARAHSLSQLDTGRLTLGHICAPVRPLLTITHALSHAWLRTWT